MLPRELGTKTACDYTNNKGGRFRKALLVGILEESEPFSVLREAVASVILDSINRGNAESNGDGRFIFLTKESKNSLEVEGGAEEEGEESDLPAPLPAMASVATALVDFPSPPPGVQRVFSSTDDIQRAYLSVQNNDATTTDASNVDKCNRKRSASDLKSTEAAPHVPQVRPSQGNASGRNGEREEKNASAVPPFSEASASVDDSAAVEAWASKRSSGSFIG